MQHVVFDTWFQIPGSEFYTYSRYTPALDSNELNLVRGYGVNLGGNLGWQVYDSEQAARNALAYRLGASR